jgi:type II secretory pathway pseudopilin PulG
MTALTLPFPSRALTRRARRGFGLLEVILVFAIVIGTAAVTFGVFIPAQRAADVSHDRQMAQTVAANIMTIFPANWPAPNGPAVEDAYYAHPLSFGKGFCDPAADAIHSVGCFSAFTGESMGLSESDGGGAQPYGIGFALFFNDLTTDQCIALLSGGPGSIGAQGAGTAPGIAHQLKTQGEVVSFCTGASSGGFVSQLYLDYSPSPWPSYWLQP